MSRRSRFRRGWLVLVLVAGCSQGAPGDEVTHSETDAEAAEWQDAGDGHNAYVQGRFHLAEGDAETALPFLRAAWEADSGKKDYKESFRQALLAVGQELYQEQQYDRAWETLSEADGVESTSDLDYLRGLVAYSWAESEESQDNDARWERLAWAEDAFRSVLERDSKDADAAFNLGAVLMASEQFEEAAEIYGQLLADRPTDGGLYLALSRVHSMSGETEMALTEEAVGKALRAGDPVDNPGIWARRAAERFVGSDLALVYEELGSPEALYTYTVPGGVLVEVWFYRGLGRVEAFREGGRVGPSVYLEK